MAKATIVWAALMMTAACGQDGISRVTLHMSGLAPLEGGAHYEGWVVTKERALSAGKFDVAADGTLITYPAGLPVRDGVFLLGEMVEKAATVVLSIEPAGDVDPNAGVSKLMAGDVIGGRAPLSIAHPMALATDFAAAAGEFDFMTPTDDDPANDVAGLWFVKRTPQAVVPGLSVPSLPAGWMYEGWAVVDVGTPQEMALSTGKFRTAAGRDMEAMFSGPMQGPEVPGEDFVARLPGGLAKVDLTRNSRIVLTVEPDPDDSPAPSRLKPLVQVAPDKVRTLVNDAPATMPTGMAVLE